MVEVDRSSYQVEVLEKSPGVFEATINGGPELDFTGNGATEDEAIKDAQDVLLTALNEVMGRLSSPADINQPIAE